MLVRVRAAGGPLAFGGREILDGKGHAVQRSAELAIPGLAIELGRDGERLVWVDEAKGVQLWIDRGNAGEAVLDHARGGQRAGANATRDLGRRHVAEVEIDGR